MGKTQKGALWLDENKCSVYDFYQYFRNVEDVKVAECMKLLTFMDLDEIEELTKYNDERMNSAKERLAFEVTKLVHGEEEATKAQAAARALFAGGADMSNVPTVTISKELLGSTVLDIMAQTKIVPSKAEGRRLIQQGGLSLNGEKVTDIARVLTEADLKDGEALIKRGKKNYNKIVVE